jgi:molecular chaperone DnaK
MSHVLGIDLGTTHSLAATLHEGQPHLIINERGSRLTPSVVAFRGEYSALVGDLAKQRAVLDHRNTIQNAKRKMGSDHVYAVAGRAYTPTAVSALVLRKLVASTRAYLEETPREAVITVPAYFNHRQRLATKQAAELAGLKVLKLLNEPTAAALAYAHRRAEDANLLVVDLGGGTLDVTLLERRNRTHRVLASGGSNFLGGLDFDHRVVGYLARRFRERTGHDPLADPVAYQQLAIAAERAKIDLSSVESTRAHVPYIASGSHGPQHLDEPLHRALFESLADDLVFALRQLILETFRQAGVPVSWAERTILAGGATRMPLVPRLVEELTGRAPLRDLNPDEIVAVGAALQAGILAGQLDDLAFYDATPFTLGVEDGWGGILPVLPANTPYPTSRTRLFNIACPPQKRLDIHIVQQESPHPEVPLISLGRFELPRAAEQEGPIEVSFAIDRDGLLEVRARHASHGEPRSLAVTALPAAESGPSVPEVLDVRVS